MTTERPNPKRRWCRFSLRTFLAIVLVLGVWLGSLVHRVNKQRKAVLRVTDMGGTVNYDYELNVEDAHSPISSVFVLTIARMSALTDSGLIPTDGLNPNTQRASFLPAP